MIDVNARSASDAVVAALRDNAHEFVAVRGVDVWLPALRPMRTAAEGSVLRRRGVYLITGGLGGLGRVCAEALADTGIEPRIALLGRSVTGGEEFAAELTAGGAEVEVIAADVADEARLAAAIELVHKRFGPVNGVLHAAGVAGNGLVELRTEQQINAVLAAKVDGGALLHRLLADERDLDFVVHYGSRAALTGLVGSGDYAAANAYLGALAAAESGCDRHVVTVHWPGWAEVGMAARATTPVRSDVDSSGVIVVDLCLDGTEWYLDEHRIAGEPVLPGTGYLDLILTVAARRGLVPEDQPVAVSDLVFEAPLRVKSPTSVRVEFEPQDGGFSVVVRSRQADTAAWSGHGRAVLSVSGAEPRNVDLGEVLGQAAEDGRPLPTGPDGVVVAFGPRWKNARSLVACEDRLVAELALPEEYRADLDDHRAHPALVDTATSMVQSASAAPFLPFHYREVVLFRPVPADTVAVARETGRPGGSLVCDVTMYDLRGREVLRVTGFTMREVDPHAFAREVSAPPDQEQTRPVNALLAPADGAALLRRIIDAPGPAQVVVLGPGDSLPGYVRLRDGEAIITVTPAPEPKADREAVAPEPVPAADGGDGTEGRLRVLWEQLIGVADIGPDEDFFDIGGNSLAAVQLVSRIRETFGIQLSVGVIFEMGTIRRLSDEISRATVS